MFTCSEEFSLPLLSAHYKKRYLASALQVLEAQQQMITPGGKNILHYILRRKSKFLKMAHYPKGDRIDLDSGAQYFYHCHREDRVSTEHGHFHCFLRYDYIPKSIKPTPLPDWDIYLDNPMTHIVAIAMNQFGQPIRLFTVNRWVTSEIWYDASHIERFLKRFTMNKQDLPYWPVLDKWMLGMLQLFTPQIIWLLQARDRRIADYRLYNGTNNPFLDHSLEELSEISIDLKKQIEWVMG